MRIIALGILFLASILFLSYGNKRNKIPYLIMGLVAIIVMISASEIVLRFYPVIVNIMLFLLFSLSMRGGDSIIFTFAQKWEKNTATSPDRAAILRYCRKVNVVWCIFFVFNIFISSYTVFFGSSFIWTIYNSCIVYILMGAIFAIEFIVRYFVKKKLCARIFLSEANASSRDMDHVIAYSGSYSDGKYTTWHDYLEDTSRIRGFIIRHDSEAVVVHIDDFYLFLAAITAVMQCGKEVRLSANGSHEFMNEMAEDGSIIITDNESVGFDIREILKNGSRDSLDFPAVSSSAVVNLYTSGSTGKPKPIHHTIMELEKDNYFFLDQWRNDFQSRVVVSSVNPHHIFGLIFAVLRPLSEGIPFRRERVSDPSRLLGLQKDRLLFVSTPFFLKMCVEDPDLKVSLHLNDPYIVVSGGPLPKDIAEKAERILSAWPTEIYGSTETGGIAWRITKNGEQWHPGKYVSLRKDSDGCLVMRCNCLADGQEIHINDLVDFDQAGSFHLLGRSDSVVKLAEKRISLIEVNERIIETGLASDAYVMLLDGNRQYLAAAVVLSGKGKTELGALSDFDKVRIFRTIPRNAIGKIQKEEVVGLFLRDGKEC